MCQYLVTFMSNLISRLSVRVTYNTLRRRESPNQTRFSQQEILLDAMNIERMFCLEYWKDFASFRSIQDFRAENISCVTQRYENNFENSIKKNQEEYSKVFTCIQGTYQSLICVKVKNKIESISARRKCKSSTSGDLEVQVILMFW